jgi:hypothetical protein
MALSFAGFVGLVLWASTHPADHWSPGIDAEWLARQHPAPVVEARQPPQVAAPRGLADTPADPRIARAELARQVGRTVRLRMVSGADRIGTIRAVSGGSLQLRTMLHGGYADFRIALEQIQYALPAE